MYLHNVRASSQSITPLSTPAGSTGIACKLAGSLHTAPAACPHLVLAGRLLPRLQLLQRRCQLHPQLERLAAGCTQTRCLLLLLLGCCSCCTPCRAMRRRQADRTGRRRRRGAASLQHGHPRSQHLLLLKEVCGLTLLPRQRRRQPRILALQLRLQALPGGHPLLHPPRCLGVPPLQLRRPLLCCRPGGCQLPVLCLQRGRGLGCEPTVGLQLGRQALQRRLPPAQRLLLPCDPGVTTGNSLPRLLRRPLALALQPEGSRWQSMWGMEHARRAPAVPGTAQPGQDGAAARRQPVTGEHGGAG